MWKAAWSVPTVVSVSRLKCSAGSPTRLLCGTRTSGTTAYWRRTTGKYCPAPSRCGGRRNTPRSAYTPSLTARVSLRGSMTASRTSTSVQGWRSRQTAADGRACSAVTCSAVSITTVRRWNYTTAPRSSAATTKRYCGRRTPTFVTIRICTR